MNTWFMANWAIVHWDAFVNNIVISSCSDLGLVKSVLHISVLEGLTDQSKLLHEGAD